MSKKEETEIKIFQVHAKPGSHMNGEVNIIMEDNKDRGDNTTEIDVIKTVLFTIRQ